MASAQPAVKRGGRAHFFTLAGQPPRPESITFDEEGRAVVGVDFDQAPWPEGPTYWNLMGDYLREHSIPDGCDSRRQLACLLKGLWIFEDVATRPAASFKRADGLHYVTTRRAQGMKDGTIRRELTIVSAAFNHAVKWERLEKAPSFPSVKGGAPRMRFLTEEEVRRLFALPMSWRLRMFWLLAFETGVRSRAIEDLTWDRVDLANRVIDFRIPGKNHKNKRRPIAPINDRLLPRLVAARQRWECGHFDDPLVIGKGPSTYNACKAQMLAIGINEDGVARHVARHTFCSWRVQRGYEYAKVGALIADSASMVEKTYAHLAPKHLMNASNMTARAA